MFLIILHRYTRPHLQLGRVAAGGRDFVMTDRQSHMESTFSFQAGASIVTGSDRLARHLHERYAREQLAAGKSAWQRPDILPVGAFWRRLAERLQSEAATPLAERRILSRTVVACLWEQRVAADFAGRPLVQAAGAAKTALDAWLLCRDWQIDTRVLADDSLEESRLLAAWGADFEARCAREGWLPEYALPEAVLAALELHAANTRLLPKKIQLAGFIDIPPAVQAQWQALAVLGVEISELPAVERKSEIRQIVCRDPHAETEAAAAWLRARLEENPQASLALVVPDLSQRRAKIRRALLETLAPEVLPQFSGKALPFNFSLGEALASQPLVHDALLLLEAANGRMGFAAAARLCRSPYLAPTEEANRRLLLEGFLRAEGYAEFRLRDWQFAAGRLDCVQLAAALERYSQAVREQAREALPSEWSRIFSYWLELLGWCRGRALDSAEYQAREAWHGVLGRLAELDAVLGKVSRAVALNWLRRFANETLFQPKAAAAPVQVLGLLEVTGMHFDAVWVMGMDDETLPASPRPNPFLPMALQREHNLPNASAAREQVFARQIFKGLLNAASHVMFSHAAQENNAERRVSPLLAQVKFADSVETHIESVAKRLVAARAEENILDNQGSSHPGGQVRGGTTLLQDQSHCAFRAFAIHRLQASEWPTPQAGPDARVRGLIVHEVMEHLWTRWRSRSELANAHAWDDFEAVLRETVSSVVDESVRRERHRWTPSLRDLEIERLVKLLKRWLENGELARPEFTVTEIEGRQADGSQVETLVTAGPLQLRGKLDRVDRLTDGREIIIDYKTGDAPTKNAFFGERPVAPQLPAYVLARKQGGRKVPDGIAVVSLKTGKEDMRGIVAGDENDTGIAGLDSVAKSDAVDSWEEAIAHWEQSIHALGEQFAAGHAEVNPLRGACDYCHLALFCRIAEQREFAEEDNGE